MLSEERNIVKRLQRLMSKSKKKEKSDDLDIARKQIKKHKKALETLKRYDEE